MVGELDEHIWELGFPGWRDVSGSTSVAGLVTHGRGGIYLLGFANGERYVGRTKDVVQRFSQHRGVHADIVSFTFKPMAAVVAADEERHCIHTLEAKGLLLRNLAEMSVVQGERVFDKVITPEEQERWLAGDRSGHKDGSRVQDPDLQRRYRSRFEKLMRQPQADDALFLLGAYLNSVIPFPRRTELTYWSASCLPGALRVNLNMQEVFFVWWDDDGLYAYVLLARSPFEREFGGIVKSCGSVD